ncbi:hypothetical protein SAMN00767673_2510 [Rubrobacter radiotolerans DSM 5868]|nr:hypothetical protein SAMN00767673_2510 [Rubrobacter radiotolerans DSM 5868]
MTLIAFYFAVISLASSLFFNQVEAWHGPVRSFQTSLKELKTVEQWRRADEQRKPIEAAAPNLFAALVGLLVLGLTALAFLVPTPSRPPFDPFLFLRLPLALVVALFWGLGLARLIDGHRRLGRAKKSIRKGMNG